MSGSSWVPESRVRIVLRYGDERTARAVAEAVSPDNLEAPQGLRVETWVHGGEVFTAIEGRRPLETIVSTVEDLLSCVQAAERALNVLGWARGEKDKSPAPSNKTQSPEMW